MRRPTLLSLLLLTTLGVSQPATRLWIKTSSTVGNDNYEDMALDAAGNAYVCGTGIVTATGKYGFLIVKYDRNGVKIWEKLLPGSSGQSSAVKIVLDTAGNSYVVGNAKVGAPATQSRIVKLSPTGVTLYDVEGTAASASQWFSVAVNSLGEATATGYVNNGGGKIMRTTHFLPTGVAAWTRDYSYPNNSVDQHGTDVLVDSSNNIYVCGVHNAFPNGCANTIVKYSRTSTQQWMQHINNGSINYPRRFNLLNGNEPAVACEVKQGTNNSIFVNYLDTNGVLKSRQSKVTSGPLPISIRGLDYDSNGRSYLAAARFDSTTSELVTQIQNFEQPGSPQFTFEGFGPPDIRALCAGPSPEDYYFATFAGGTGPRPATISGRKLLGQLTTQIPVFDEKIFGSTANNQTPYASVQALKTDSNGDLYAIGILTGANAVDAFIVKYETGPLANNDSVSVNAGEAVNSVRSLLVNDAQFGSAQLAVIQQPQHGSLSVAADGMYTYSPDAGFAGVDRAYYRLTRNATQVRSSTAEIEFNVVPNAASVSVSPTSVKFLDYYFVTATVGEVVNYNYPINIISDNSAATGIVGNFLIGKDRNYGVQRYIAGSVSTPTNATITIRSGRTSRATTITVRP